MITAWKSQTAPILENVKKSVKDWNYDWCESSLNFEPLFAKKNSDDVCRQYTKNGYSIHDVFRSNISIPCNAITPSILTDDVWKIKINLPQMTMQIHYKGINIKNDLRLHQSAKSNYIYPVFSIITQNNHALRLLDAYIR